jgi:hypothetical protein
MKSKEMIVPIKKNGSFTEDHLATAKSLARKSSFPQYYTNIVFKSLEYIDIDLIDADLIVRGGYGSSQSIRANGLNEKYAELKTDLLENGYRIYEKLIFVKPLLGGKFKLLDGRTKDKILTEKNFKNRICVIVNIDDEEEEDYGLLLNSGEDSAPAGLNKLIDLINGANKRIDKGTLELDYDEIFKWINKVCGKGKFTGKKRSDLAWQIFHHQNAIQSSGLLPISWASRKEVNAWLKGKNYIETPTVVYLPYAASSPIKAFFAAAELAQQKPGKEVRLVIYVSKLDGYNLQKCYLEAILKFKQLWFQYINKIGMTYYGNAKSYDNKVKLYGCIPSQIEDICEDMDKLIIFGKTDQKINDNYLVSQGLNSFFNTNEEDEEQLFDEEEDEEYA